MIHTTKVNSLAHKENTYSCDLTPGDLILCLGSLGFIVSKTLSNAGNKRGKTSELNSYNIVVFEYENFLSGFTRTYRSIRSDIKFHVVYKVNY